MTSSERYDILGRALSIGSKGEMNDQEVEVYGRIQKILLETPGYAEFYRDRINAARAKYDDVMETGDVSEAAYYRTAWSDSQNGFSAMRHLPSVETVRVLGDFLADDRGRTVLPPNASLDDKQHAAMEIPNSDAATKTLQALPILSKPFKTRSPDYFVAGETASCLDSWRLWYEQIKAGTRTFRFEGDPQEYDLNGPASKEKLQRIALSHKRDEERAAERRPSQSDPDSAAVQKIGSNGFPVASVAAACGIVVVAILYFFGVRRSRAS